MSAAPIPGTCASSIETLRRLCTQLVNAAEGMSDADAADFFSKHGQKFTADLKCLRDQQLAQGLGDSVTKQALWLRRQRQIRARMAA